MKRFSFTEPEVNAEICAQSIKYDNLSTEDLMYTWAGCTKYRLNQIHSEASTISEAINLWPQYKGSIGSQLVGILYSVIF